MAGLGDFCVEADDVGVGMGVPTVVDGGTSGVATFDISRRAIIDHPATQTRVLSFLDPNQLYLATKDFICHKLEIAGDLRNLDATSLAASLERNQDVVVGAKVRACHVGDPEFSPFLAAAQEVMGHRPVMVHLGRFPFTPVITPSVIRTSVVVSISAAGSMTRPPLSTVAAILPGCAGPEAAVQGRGPVFSRP